MTDREAVECIEAMVDAWRKQVMNDDQALRSIRAYLNDLEQEPTND